MLDGHRRVAAARHLGQVEIEAEVTAFVPLGDAQAQRVAAERWAFEQATGLVRIGAVEPGHYPWLEERIRTYALEQGLVDLHEAARRWEAAVYRPLARKIRGRRLSHLVPGERTADVFVRVATIRDEAVHREGRVLDWDAALPRLQTAMPARADRS